MIEVLLVVLGILGIAATLFGVFQGIEWLITKLRWKERRMLRGKGRVVRRDGPTTLNQGDGSVFLRDIEFIDGTIVAPDERFRKTWEIQNVGSLVWEGRHLQRVGAPEGPGLLKSPVRIPIPTTRPGEVVQISVELQAPSTEGTSTARFKMTDKAGALCFADRYREGLFVTANVVHRRGEPRENAANEDAFAGDDTTPIKCSDEAKEAFVRMRRQLRESYVSGNAVERPWLEELRRMGLLDVSREDAGWWSANRHKGMVDIFRLNARGAEALDRLCNERGISD